MPFVVSAYFVASLKEYPVSLLAICGNSMLQSQGHFNHRRPPLSLMGMNRVSCSMLLIGQITYRPVASTDPLDNFFPTAGLGKGKICLGSLVDLGDFFKNTLDWRRGT